MAEFEKWKNPDKPNFVISKKSPTATDANDEDAVSASVLVAWLPLDFCCMVTHLFLFCVASLSFYFRIVLLVVLIYFYREGGLFLSTNDKLFRWWGMALIIWAWSIYVSINRIIPTIQWHGFTYYKYNEICFDDIYLSLLVFPSQQSV